MIGPGPLFRNSAAGKRHCPAGEGRSTTNLRWMSACGVQGGTKRVSGVPMKMMGEPGMSEKWQNKANLDSALADNLTILNVEPLSIIDAKQSQFRRVGRGDAQSRLEGTRISRRGPAIFRSVDLSSRAGRDCRTEKVPNEPNLLSRLID